MSDEPTLAECIAWQERTVRRCQDYATYSAECGEPDEPDATTLRAASAILAHLRRLASAPPDAVWLAVPWERLKRKIPREAQGTWLTPESSPIQPRPCVKMH
jgi:hypothetical protein